MNTWELIEELDKVAAKVRELRQDGWIDAVARPLGELELQTRKLAIDLERRIPG